MGTLYQLLTLPACFLLLGLLRGDCRSLLAALVRRLAVLVGANDAARFELMKCFSPGVSCGFMDSMRRRGLVVAKENSRRKAAPGPGGESRNCGATDALFAGPGNGATRRRSLAPQAAARTFGSAGSGTRGRRFVLGSVIGSPMTATARTAT
jgi:hypothetical protein